MTEATPATTFEGFSISHAAILDGTTGAEEVDGDIYGVREGSIGIDQSNFDNTGDDTILSTWNWFNFANISVTAGYVPFALLELLYGTPFTSSGTGLNITYEIPFLQEDSMNQPAKPMLVRIPSKDAAGHVRRMDFVFYKVQFAPMAIDGPVYKNGLVLHYNGRALLSSVNEKGQALTKKAVGRLVNAPG